MNLAFSALGEGGAGGFPGGEFPGGGFPELPEGCELPGGDGGEPGGPGGGDGFLSGSNILLERFPTNPEFKALYHGQIKTLTASLYDSGVGDQLLTPELMSLRPKRPTW